MYITLLLGWPCENTTFPFGYVATRCGAPADSRNASTSKSACISLALSGRAFVFDIVNRCRIIARGWTSGGSDACNVTALVAAFT
jgi:hypothetical protein